MPMILFQSQYEFLVPNKKEMSFEVSSCFPMVCQDCWNRRLGSSAAKTLRTHFANDIVAKRNQILQCGSVKEALQVSADLNPPGYTAGHWQAAGIKSMCCKAEVLVFIPQDLLRSVYEYADFYQPPDSSYEHLVDISDAQTHERSPPTVFKTHDSRKAYLL